MNNKLGKRLLEVEQQLNATQKAEKRKAAAAAAAASTRDTRWFNSSVIRGLLVFFAATLPLWYDLTVPEVSGDIRWAVNILISFLSLLVALGIAWNADKRSETGVSVGFRWPLILWFALGLAVWAALSMVDSIAFDRGIMQIKALYAQLLLIAIAYGVWKSGFGRRLVWALVIPVGFTSFLGICQFMGWNDATFVAALREVPLLGPVLAWAWPTTGFDPNWVMPLRQSGGVFGWIAGWIPVEGPITVITNYFLQSAVPGSTFANKNLAGSWTAMMIPLLMYVLVVSKTRSGKVLASAWLALASLFLIYSRARASWVALLFAMIVLAGIVAFSPAWRHALRERVTPRLVLTAVPALILLAIFGGQISPLKGSHAIDRSPGAQLASLAGNTSWEEYGGRLAYNLNGLVVTKDYWFNGVGLGAFFSIYPRYNDAWVPTPANSYSVMARPQRSHDDVMQAFTEMGVPGGLFYCGMMLMGLWMAWRLRTKEAIEKVGLFPLFGGMSLLTINVNSLMDFPMQLPTAPATACMLMGVMAGSFVHVYPASVWGPKLRLTLQRWMIVAMLAVVTFAGCWALWDSYKFRQANQVLKIAMIRIMSGIVDDETLRVINLAQSMYARDPRIHEHLAVAYANYKGSQPMPLEDRIKNIEWVVERGDPWGPNHLVNLAGQYLQVAEARMAQGDVVGSQAMLAKVEDYYARLQHVADFSHYTWGVGGMLRLLQGRNADALPLFERALQIDPTYPPAVQGVIMARQRLGITPTTPAQ